MKWIHAPATLIALALTAASLCPPSGARAAIVQVDTKGGAPPPPSPAARVGDPDNPPAEVVAGIPIDFRYVAVRTHKLALTEEEAVKAALKEVGATEYRGPQAEPGTGGGPHSAPLAESAVVLNLLTHPALYAGREWIDPEERIPPEWVPVINQRQQLVRETLRAVGRIQMYHLDEVPAFADGMIIGTGFVVAPDVIMTNRHVAELFAEVDKPGYPFKTDGRGANKALVKINFAGVSDDAPDLHKLVRVLYVAPKDQLDVALIQMEASVLHFLRTPLALQTTEPASRKPERRMMVCGYPTGPALQQMLRTLRVKRLSLGRLSGVYDWRGRPRLYHSCLSINGSSGSPLVDLETGRVWGLHFWGNDDGRGNIAEPMWDVCQIPEVRRILGQAVTNPPPPLPPPGAQPPPSGVAEVQRSRPVLFACGDTVADGQTPPPGWFGPGGAELQRVRGVLPSVGVVSRRVATPPADRSRQAAPPPTEPVGTGFLIAPGLLVAPTPEPPPPNPAARPARGSYYVEFDRSKCRAGGDADPRQLRQFDLEVVLTLDPSPDLARPVTLFRLRPRAGESLPPPLRLETGADSGAIDVGAGVFTVGHPLRDARMPESVFVNVFPPPYGVKRVALGKVTAVVPDGAPPDDLWHDCSTSAGDSGAPLVSLASGKVIAVHYAGWYLKGNSAIPIGKILAHPKVREIEEIRQILKPD